MIFRPLTPPCAFAYEKYAAIPPGIGAYPEAGPLSGNVPSSKIVLAVTPGVADGVAPAVTTRTPDTATAAASSSNVFFMRLLSLSRTDLGGWSWADYTSPTSE